MSGNVPQPWSPQSLAEGAPGEMLHAHGMARSAREKLIATVYRTSHHRHEHADPVTRRWMLTLDAVRRGAPDLAAELAQGLPSPWRPVWATGPQHPAHERPVRQIACGVLDGRPIVVSLGEDRTARVRDLTDGRPIGDPLGTDVEAVALTELDGRTAAVLGRSDGTVSLLDPAARTPLGGTARIATGSATAVACADLDGRKTIVVGDSGRRALVFDAATGEQVGPRLVPLYGEEARAVAALPTARGPVVATAIGQASPLWDLRTGRQIASDESARITDVAVVEDQDGPGFLTVSYGGGLRVLDPVDATCRGGTFGAWQPGCTAAVAGHLVATGAQDGSVLVWDLRTRRPIGTPLRFPDQVGAIAWSPDGRLVVAFGHDLAVLAPQGEPSPDPTLHNRWKLAAPPRHRPRSLPGRPLPWEHHHLAVRTVGDRNVAFMQDGPDIRHLDPVTGEPLGPGIRIGDDRTWAVGELHHRPVLAHLHNRTLSLVDAMTGAPIWRRPLPAHGPAPLLHITELDGLPTLLLAWHDDRLENGRLDMYGLRFGTPLGTVNHGHRVLTFAESGTRLLIQGPGEPPWHGTLQLWDPFGGTTYGPTFGSNHDTVALKNGHPLVATGNKSGVIALWDPLTGIRQQTIAVCPAPITDLAWGPDDLLHAVYAGSLTTFRPTRQETATP
ncbi:WD40 repeat [Thermomonospora echinospora]|uniref:WD40 repeat n=1 Tax=Thermomonospora echinospora TaxID=1992 RepID=A0A1H6CD62_9ACTN|nr:WD40 repeat domain-containing protein [Thermomonospora echinospora]SEG70921.1 WD40 repeat [Thermomonospora echinospora]